MVIVDGSAKSASLLTVPHWLHAVQINPSDFGMSIQDSKRRNLIILLISPPFVSLLMAQHWHQAIMIIPFFFGKSTQECKRQY
jgi:hypothetical protein